MEYGNILIRGAQVYAPEYLGEKDVLVIGGKIIAVEDKIRRPLSDMKVINAKGKILIPGLFDGHVHVTGGGGENGFSSRVEPLSSKLLYSCGVTSVLGMLGTDSITRDVKSLVAKVKALKEEGMSAWCLTGAYNVESPTLTGSVADDICFIDEVIGVKVALNDHRCSMPTAQELTRLAANVRLAALTSKKAGPVHIHMGRGKKGMQLIFDCLENSDLPVRHFRPTHCGPHLEDAKRLADLGGMIDISAKLDSEKSADMVKEFVDAIPLAQLTMSSDAGGSLPVWNDKKEMIGMKVGTPETLLKTVRKLAVREDMSFADALSLITKNPAVSLGHPEKGQIIPGADADLVLVDHEIKVLAVYTDGLLRYKG